MLDSFQRNPQGRAQLFLADLVGYHNLLNIIRLAFFALAYRFLPFFLIPFADIDKQNNVGFLEVYRADFDSGFDYNTSNAIDS